jgi:hypothetical protein
VEKLQWNVKFSPAVNQWVSPTLPGGNQTCGKRCKNARKTGEVASVKFLIVVAGKRI